MAFLLPENIPSQSGTPQQLRLVAKALRDSTPEQVTVWLRETDRGSKYLVVLDPTAGIAVIDAPSLSRPGRKRRDRVFDSFDMIGVPQQVAQSAEELTNRANAARIEALPVKCVLAFPELDEVPKKRLGEADRGLPILTRRDLSDDRLKKELRRILGGNRPSPLSEQQHKQARAVINPEIVLPQSQSESLPLFQDPDTAPEDVIQVMDREQERVAEHLGPGYRVLRGVAGSGKTLVLAHRARYLHTHWPKWRILVVCYNRVLARALEAMVDPDERLKVTNIDRLAYELAGQGSRKSALDFDALALEASKIARHQPDSERFDAVLVDEAQDFDHLRLNLAYAMLTSDRLEPPNLLSPDRDNFVMAYDIAQNVYRRGGARWNPPGVDAHGRPRTARGRSTVFRMNYRNTREILEFSMNLLAGSRDWGSASVDLDDPAAPIPPTAAKRSGPAPRLAHYRDLRGEAEGISRRVSEMLDEGVPPHAIAVLYGCPALQKMLWRSFLQRRLPYFHVQHNRENKDLAIRVRDKVRVSTLTGIKGLEFSRVLIGGVNDLRVRDVDAGDQFQAAKSQLYAAMTRAMDTLEITMSGDGPIGVALREAEHLQRPRPAGATMPDS